MSEPLRLLVVDDESLARARLRTLLADCREPAADAAAEAADTVTAMTLLRHEHFDAVLLDVHMPGADGLALARALKELAEPPAVIFVTAHVEHAVAAFELEALDYLTKPVRLERLQQALRKVRRRVDDGPPTDTETGQWVLIQERGQMLRVPLSDVVYFKAELKYLTVRTRTRSYILEAALSEFEERHAARFLRVHRNALVARHAVRALQRQDDPEEGGEGWAVRLDGVAETLAVSRRQLASVRELLTR